MVLGFLRGIGGLLAYEWRRGTLRQTLRLTRTRGRFTLYKEPCHADLLREKAKKNGPRPFLLFHDRTLSFTRMDADANRTAHFLRSLGARQGQTVAVMMKNSPRWLDAFFGAQRLGMCPVPVNTALRGDQLAHIFNHSEARFAFLDHDMLPFYDKISGSLASPPVVIVNTEGAPSGFTVGGLESMDAAYGSGMSAADPGVAPREGDICLLMYTSGTTGLPKGVPTRYGRTGVKMMSVVSHTLLSPRDVYFTCLPLFHANALMLTVMNALNADARVALRERFSASRFWDEVRETGATVFNTIGGMIPILMKQPPRPADRSHRVRYILSAACPADMWRPFEERFGVKIIEGYGAVDLGGFVVINWGQAPVGSIGKPLGAKYRLVDDAMNDVPPGTPGELVFPGSKGEKAVEYYKDDRATESKLSGGWVHTGDLLYADRKGYLYFVGRKTESLRRRGENISAYEVERAILRHPGIAECAVYPVPSDLGEDDVMAAVVGTEGRAVDPKEIADYLRDRLAKFAVPRYWRIMPELPKTETQRVIKTVLQQQGVTPDTVDLEPSAH